MPITAVSPLKMPRRSSRLSDAASAAPGSAGHSLDGGRNASNLAPKGRVRKPTNDAQRAASDVGTKNEKRVKVVSNSVTNSSSIQLCLFETGVPSSAEAGGKAKRGRATKAGSAILKNHEKGENVAAVEPSTRKRKSKTNEDAITAQGDTTHTKETPEKKEATKREQKPAKTPKITGPLPDREMEFALWKKGFQCVAGVDEAGRGPLAGPVVAAACILPKDADAKLLEGINDSKGVHEEQREEIYERLVNHPDVRYAVGIKDHNDIDSVNILKATMQAMAQAVAGLPSDSKPDYVLIDGNKCPPDLVTPSQAVIGGDAKVTAIAAASIIAKVTRDRIMLQLDKEFPQYGFAQHKGYGTASHRQLIHQHGPSRVHRKSFNPVKTILGWTPPEGY